MNLLADESVDKPIVERLRQDSHNVLYIAELEQNVEGASVFSIRRLAAIDGEQEALEHWQIKRDNTRRGIVEVISNDSQ
jgi:anti-sigma-K factor RskA